MRLPSLVVPEVPIVGTSSGFQVRRIFCVGQNYAEHAREMGADPDRQAPFFFSKPADTIAWSGSTIAYPPRTLQLEHEVEMVLCLGDGGASVAVSQASTLIFGYAAGLDLTRRDMQKMAKSTGRPWDMAKGFDLSAPIAAIQPGCPPKHGSISLHVNGIERQTGNLDQMTWTPAEIIAELSTYVALRAGDLIFTGTPAGVSPVRPGDELVASVEGAPDLRVLIGVAQ